jgi:GGDEF domain-containing protein
VRLGVIFADLDHFKRINDSLGHAAGDSVLCESARRLRGVLRPDDLLVRQGGEEFVALLRVQDERELQQIAERMRTAIGAQPMQTAQGALTVTLSLGCSLAGAAETRSNSRWRVPTPLCTRRNGRAATACTTVKRRRTERGARTPETRRNKEPPTWLQPWLPTCTSSRCC